VLEVHSPPLEKVELMRKTSLYGQRESIQLPNPALSTRTNSDTTLYGPMRRRSLQQPGLITRKEFGANDPRKSLPSQSKNIDQLQDYYYDPSRSTSSPLANLAALGRPVLATSPGPRVQTPNDMDYGFIGAYKLGSLRITNGTISPTPSDGRPQTATGEEDCLTMGARQKESNHRPGLSQRSNTLVPADTVKPAWIVREESPLRQSQKTEPRALSIKTNQAQLDPSLALFDFTVSKLPSGHTPSKHSHSLSLELAKQYRDELPLSPFSFDVPEPSPLTPGFQATSKHTAVEDDLFEAEPDSPRSNTSPSASAQHSFDSGYGTSGRPIVVKGPREYIPKPLVKADSGYASIISLRSFKKDVAPAVPAKEAQMTPTRETMPRIASSTYSAATSPAITATTMPQGALELPAGSAIEKLSGPPVPAKIRIPKDHFPEQQSPVVPPKVLERVISKESKAHKRQQSLPNTSKTNQVPDRPLIAEAKANTTQVAFLTQNRPKSVQPSVTAPVYTVQAFRSASDALNIPSVPLETGRKLEQRVSGFPVAAFPNTFSASVGLRKSSSKETLGTIFSVGSAEVRDEVEYARLQGKLPPIPTTILENPTAVSERKPAPSRRSTFQATASSLPFWKSFDTRKNSTQPKSRQPEIILPTKSVEQQREEYEAHVTSFNTVASSLGSSPYDIAGSVGRPKSSGAALRAKSVTSQFEAEAAERFARSRTVSQESQVSSMLHSRRSYDSISGGNQILPGTPSKSHSRRNSRDLPPSAHSNRPGWKAVTTAPGRPLVFVAPELHDSYVPEVEPSPVSGEIKQRRPPPISLNNPRASLPAMRSSRSQPQTPQLMSPTRAPPDLPTFISKDPVAKVQDPWSLQKSFWAQRRQSAEALQTRKSFEVSRSSSRRPSIDSQPESKVQYASSIQRASTTQPRQSYDYDERSRDAYGSTQPKRQHWTGHSTGSHRNFSPQWVQRQTSARYDHTYESNAHASNPNPEYGYYNQADDGYYAQPEQNATAHADLPQQIHSQTNSTNDMLVLDRFSGGLGYNYDPNFGLVGSAGSATSGNVSRAPRKGVEASQLYGVDLSDVPVFLQRVKIES
jgi:hypothetical protein